VKQLIRIFFLTAHDFFCRPTKYRFLGSLHTLNHSLRRAHLRHAFVAQIALPDYQAIGLLASGQCQALVAQVQLPDHYTERGHARFSLAVIPQVTAADILAVCDRSGCRQNQACHVTFPGLSPSSSRHHEPMHRSSPVLHTGTRLVLEQTAG
jgi:hypothetical protein